MHYNVYQKPQHFNPFKKEKEPKPKISVRENPALEKSGQLSKEVTNKEKENKDSFSNLSINHSDEIGTLPKIEGLEMMFSASRSRKISIVAIIQSLAQFEKTYGKEGSEIIVDNCQCTLFGSFAPNSKTAEVMSQSLGKQTVLSGSVSKAAGKDGSSRTLQMIERPLMTVDELKSMPKGSFIVMKTGCHPMKTRLKLFFKWGIQFEGVYTVEEQAERKVLYADSEELEAEILKMFPQTADTELGEATYKKCTPKTQNRIVN